MAPMAVAWTVSAAYMRVIISTQSLCEAMAKTAPEIDLETTLRYHVKWLVFRRKKWMQAAHAS